MLVYTPHNYYILSTIYAIEPITMTMSIVYVHSNQSLDETAVADGRTDKSTTKARQTDKISFGQLAKLVEQILVQPLASLQCQAVLKRILRKWLESIGRSYETATRSQHSYISCFIRVTNAFNTNK